MTSSWKRFQQTVGEQLSALDADFEKQLGADSLDVSDDLLDFIELVMAIEYKFNIEIKDQYISKINRVQDALNYIENKINFVEFCNF